MKNYYCNNKTYKEMLDGLAFNFYDKYVQKVLYFLKNREASFLDIGCGNGSVIKFLVNKGFKNVQGCDIVNFYGENNEESKYFFVYDGENLPLEDDSFDVCGSFTTLEHVENPETFLREMVRILKQDGIGIISCPNFLSVFFTLGNDTTSTFIKKIKNLFVIVKKIILRSREFEKMERIKREKFMPDDDAIVKTNMVDILNYLRSLNVKACYISGTMTKRSFAAEFISRMPFIRLILQSCFIVFKKL